MRIAERHTSPDGQITLQVAVGDKGEIAIGFEGGEWHTHPDLLSQWLAVPEQEAIDRFVKSDGLPIILSTDGGETTEPWVSDSLPDTIRLFGIDNCLMRYWSVENVVVDDVL
jgi:hypothetical protein